MKQAPNEVHIEGILSEVNIQKKVSRGNKNMIRGNVKILVEQEIDGVVESLEIPVELFSMELTSDNKPNGAYTAIENIMNTYVSIAACGDIEQADRVRTAKCSLAMNEFYDQNGRLVSYPQIKGGFINKINKVDCKPAAIFETTIVMISEGVEDEIVRDAPTGRAIIKAAIPQYGEKVDIIPFLVENPKAIAHMKSHWNKGDTLEISGRVNFSSRTEKESSKVADGFGEGLPTYKTISVKELIIYSGSNHGLTGPTKYSAEEIQEGINRRNLELEQSKTATTASKSKPKVSFEFV